MINESSFIAKFLAGFAKFFILVIAFGFKISLTVAKVDLPPPDHSYNILMLIPFGSESHRNCFLPLATALLDRGHKVTILSCLPPKFNHPNMTEINHGVDIWRNPNMFHIRETDPTIGFGDLGMILSVIARGMYENPAVMELYNKRDSFDLFIVDEIFSESSYPFLVEKYFITISSAGVMATTSAVLGNVLNPSYVTGFIYEYPKPYSYINRLKNLVQHIFVPIFFRIYDGYPTAEKALRETFPDMPSLLSIERGLVLILANTHHTLDEAIPLLPSQVEVGGMHCRPGQPLPRDIEKFIQDSSQFPGAVIYFSLGTIAKGIALPQKYKNILFEAFSKLKFRVIWKFEDESIAVSSNVLIRKWLPQQDILAHSNVKLFITHGGLLSMQEAIYHKTPLLVLPIFGEQERNGQRIENKGFGKKLQWETLTVEVFLTAIKEMIANPKYLENVNTASKIFKDQLKTPLEKAVWWTEYVIRHKGAPQLKSSGADLSWIEYLMLDIIIPTQVLFLLIFWTIYKILSRCFVRQLNIEQKQKVN